LDDRIGRSATKSYIRVGSLCIGVSARGYSGDYNGQEDCISIYPIVGNLLDFSGFRWSRFWILDLLYFETENPKEKAHGEY